MVVEIVESCLQKLAKTLKTELKTKKNKFPNSTLHLLNNELTTLLIKLNKKKNKLNYHCIRLRKITVIWIFTWLPS